MPDPLTSDQPLSTAADRSLRLWDGVLLGLSSMVGAGIFVGLGIVAGVTGKAIVWAVGLGALVAVGNRFSQMQLATNQAVVNPLAHPPTSDRPTSNHPNGEVHRGLSSWWEFAADWSLLLAQIPIAATAALGISGYLFSALSHASNPIWLIPTAQIAVLLLTIAVFQGRRQNGLLMMLSVSVVVLSLSAFMLAGLPQLITTEPSFPSQLSSLLTVTGDQSITSLLHGTALMVVAYAGYERGACLNRAIWTPQLFKVLGAAIAFMLLLYLGVVFVVIGTVGLEVFANAVEVSVAPLEVAMREFSPRGNAWIIAVGAVVALISTLMKLIHQSSQVLLTMGQQRDIPAEFARLNATGTAPIATVASGVGIACLTLLGDVQTLWSFGAFAFLVSTAIMNLAILQRSMEQRLSRRWLPCINLLVCLVLAFSVGWDIWLVGSGLIIIGLIWRGITQWSNQQADRF